MSVKKLQSDFRFGFEFEGFAHLDSFMGDISYYDYNKDDWNDLDCNGLYDDDYDTFYDNVNSFINGQLHVTTGRTHYDGSLKNYSRGYQSFEYSSPVFKYNIRNIKRIKDFFSNMYRYGFGVNGTCGFHTHISFNKINEQDAVWMLCQIANNKSYIDEFCYMNIGNDTINFYSDRYANKDFLYEIHEALKTNDIEKIIQNINDEKYRVIRIHPQGTLEWRGPRDFLDRNNGIEAFCLKLTKIMSILSEVMHQTHLNGLTKEEFFNEIYKNRKTCHVEGHTLPFSSKTVKRLGKVGLVDKFGKDYMKYNPDIVAKRLVKSVIKNPEILVKVNNEILLDKIICHLSWNKELRQVISELIQSNNKLPLGLNRIILQYCPEMLDILSSTEISQLGESELYRYIESIYYSNENRTQICKTIKHILRNINKDLRLKCSLCFLNNSLWTIEPIIELIKEGLFENIDVSELWARYIRGYNKVVSSGIQITILKLLYTPEDLNTLYKQFVQDNLIKNVDSETSLIMMSNEPFQPFFTLVRF